MSEHESHRSRLAEEVTNLSHGGMILLAIATSLGLLASFHPYLDWFSHFRAIYLGFALAAFAVLVALQRRSTLAALTLVLVNGASVLPWFTPSLAPDCQPTMTALTLNVRATASDHDAVIELIRREQPDVLFVSELRGGLRERISALFPHVIWHPDAWEHLAVFTKYPVLGGTYVRGPNGRPTINAVLATPQGPLRVVGAHPSSPSVAAASLNRNAMLLQIAEIARTSAEPVLLLGDLNTTMFSPHYAPLEEAGLINARRGRGVMGSWPNYSALRIPIDHVMTSRELSVCDLKIGEDFGSDHLPVSASLDWHASRPELRLTSR